LAQDSTRDRRNARCKLNDLKQIKFLDTTPANADGTPLHI